MDRSTDSPTSNTPLTEDQIIATSVGAPQPLNSTIYLAPYDPAWPSLFTQLAHTRSSWRCHTAAGACGIDVSTRIVSKTDYRHGSSSGGFKR
jgi:hypothetical protein